MIEMLLNHQETIFLGVMLIVAALFLKGAILLFRVGIMIGNVSFFMKDLTEKMEKLSEHIDDIKTDLIRHDLRINKIERRKNDEMVA